MEQYRTYLRAELGKLNDIGDCTELVRKAGACLAELDLPADPAALSQRFANQGQVDLFVQDLDDQSLMALTACCGQWRENDIAIKLAPTQHPKLHLVPVDRVRLYAAEPILTDDFARLDWELRAIAQDGAVLNSDPYRTRQRGAAIAFGICLANPDPARANGYRIFDGMHRAIQMVRNGVNSVLLCVVEPILAGQTGEPRQASLKWSAIPRPIAPEDRAKLEAIIE
jgi:hypothetical protein